MAISRTFAQLHYCWGKCKLKPYNFISNLSDWQQSKVTRMCRQVCRQCWMRSKTGKHFGNIWDSWWCMSYNSVTPLLSICFGKKATVCLQWDMKRMVIKPFKVVLCCAVLGWVAQSCLILRPHQLQHARPPCPSPTPHPHKDTQICD